MRAFIVLALVAAASAALLPGGYNYGPGQSGTFQTVSGTVVAPGGYKVSNGLVGSGSQLIGTGFGSGVISSGLGSYGNGGSYSTGGSYGGGIISSGGHISSTGGTRFVGLNALDSIPQTVEYSKQFYHFSAPEEQHNEGVTRQQLSNVLKKNLQVVFIKAPENNAATNAALQLAKQAIEQRTAIYVLSKENDASQVVAQLQQVQENVQTAPEVRFVKYRTPQDIAHAKQVIQSQYDNFGGASQNFDGGVAPVLNYASNVGGSAHGVNFVNGGVGSLGGSTSGVNYVSGGSNLLGSVQSLGGSTGGVNYVSGNSGSLGGLTGGVNYVSGNSGSLGGLTGGVNFVSSGTKQYGTGSSIIGGDLVSNINTEYLPSTPLKK